MPDLDRDQLAELEADLRALARELRRLLASSEEASMPVSLDQPIGRVSRMDAIAQQSMVSAGREAARLRAAQIEAALARLEEGEFGACRACGEEIDFRRLKARPEAVFCVTCQSAREAR